MLLQRLLKIVRDQPFFPDTETGKRQQWVKDEIATKIEALFADDLAGRATSAWTPNSYRFASMDARYAIRIEARGEQTWAIVEGGLCLAKDGFWETEGLASSRTDEFLSRCRYSLPEAMAMAEAWITEHPAEVRRIMRLPPA